MSYFLTGIIAMTGPSREPTFDEGENEVTQSKSNPEGHSGVENGATTSKMQNELQGTKS